MNARPLATAIIATRNRADLLGEALASVYAQDGRGTQFNLEVVVVDDASADHTAQTVARYPEARYIRLPVNQGQAAARNAGIKSSAGTYVAFLDDDDVWLPRKLSAQVAALEAHPEAGVAYSPFIILPAAQQWAYAKGSVPSGMLFPERLGPSGSVFERMLFVNLCGIPASPLVRRDALAGVGGFDEQLQSAEDYDLWLRLAFRVPFLFVPGAVAVYRRADEGNMLRGMRAGRYENVLRQIVEQALALLPDTEENGRLKQQVRANCELRLAALLALLREPAAAWDRLHTGLTMWPELALNPSHRFIIAHIIARNSVHSPSPIEAATQRWKQINDLQAGLGRSGRVEMRRLLAAAYWQVGVVEGKGIAHPVDARQAAGAVARSLMLEPFVVRNWRGLLKFLVRHTFGFDTPQPHA